MVRNRRNALAALVLWLAFLNIAALPAAAQRAVGACCISNGSCSITTQALCDEKGGTFLGLNTTCDECLPICDDEDPCTEDSWNGRACVYEPLDCDDGNPCTTDSCFMGRCSHVPLDCDDGNPCTSDLCYMGECGHEQIPCDDKDPCTSDACVDGDCIYEPMNCNDGDACTEDSCVGGDCIHEPVNCGDGDPCTTDVCVDGDCVSEPMDCNDTDPCTNDSCQGGRCTHDPIDCNDGNDRTVDSCREGACEHTLINAPEATGAEETKPAIWFVDEAPWGDTEKALHQALCTGATLAGAKLRALLYRNQDVEDIERLLATLPLDRRPVLIFCSRETIERIDSTIVGKTLFYDTSSLQQLLEDGTERVLIGLPGQRMDWSALEASETSPNPEFQARPSGEWDASLLPDPLAWIEQLAALQPVRGESGAPVAGERVLAAFDLPGGGVCQLIFSPVEAGTGSVRQPIHLCCAEGCTAAPSIQMVTPSPQATDQEEFYAVGSEADASRRLALWFAHNAGLNTEQDETWRRIAGGQPPLEGEQELVNAFAAWLSAIGQTPAAERVAQQVPWDDEGLGYLVRFLWFREQWQGRTPPSVPWWQRWIENASDQANGKSSSHPSPLFLILAQIDPATGELAVDLLSQ